MRERETEKMVPFTQSVCNRQIHMERKSTGGCLGLKFGGNWGLTANDYGVSLWSDVLELVLMVVQPVNILNITDLYILKG